MRALAGLKKRWKLPKKVIQSKLFLLPVKYNLIPLLCVIICRVAKGKNTSGSSSIVFFFRHRQVISC